LSFLSAGCAVMKNSHSGEHHPINNLNNNELIEVLENQNLGTKGFYISKAEISISTQNGMEKILGNIKFNPSGKILVSLRAKTGLEIARIFITDDTLLVNDRINKKLYRGSSMYVKSKYGIPFSAIPIIFGDFVKGSVQNRDISECISGRLVLDEDLVRIRINYVIDCKTGKSIGVKLIDNVGKEKIEIAYSKFIRNELGLIPGVVQISDQQREMTVIINIKKIESPWSGEIDFIPGKQYEKILLQ
jgi:hypothetical protein